MAKRNFHVPLSEDLYAMLHREAERQELPATQLAREAIERYLVGLRRDLLHRQISEYALQMAGSEHDLDPELEAAGAEHLWNTLQDDAW